LLPNEGDRMKENERCEVRAEEGLREGRSLLCEHCLVSADPLLEGTDDMIDDREAGNIEKIKTKGPISVLDNLLDHFMFERRFAGRRWYFDAHFRRGGKREEEGGRRKT
jgi:hypothetical protein